MSKSEPLPSRLIRATVENFKRVELVELVFNSAGVSQVAGANGAGKSSALDALEAALGGKRHAPKEPIRRGAESARSVVETSDVIVERVWTDEGGDRFEVRTPEGFSTSRPQEYLDGILGPLAFDPVAFCEQPPPEQRATLLRLVGVDFDALDAERQAAYDERRKFSRDLKAEQARLDGMPEPEGEVPDEEVSVAALSEGLAKGMTLRDSAAAAEQLHRQAKDEVDRAEEEVRRLRKELVAAEERTERARGRMKEERAALKEAKAKVPDLDALQKSLAGAEEVNRAVRAAAQRRQQAERVAELKELVDEQNEKIEQVDHRKAELLSKTKMPVEGLGIGEDGVTYRDVPLEQASQSERVRVGVAICAALSPGLQLAIVRQGNDLDDESLRALDEEARRLGLQVVLERIKRGSGLVATIEDGKVREEADDDNPEA